MGTLIRLRKDLARLKSNPVSEFFTVYGLVNDNMMEWEVYLIGPPDTMYEGGIYKAVMKFPSEYPMKPPSLTFVCDMFHPNIYKDGKVCISTLQTGPADSDGGQYWRPILGVEQALLAVASLLSDPNTDDPADVKASNMYKQDRDMYKKICKFNAEKSLKLVPDDFVKPEVKNDPKAVENGNEPKREGLKLSVVDQQVSDTPEYDEDNDGDFEYDVGEESDFEYSSESDEESETTEDTNSNQEEDEGIDLTIYNSDDEIDQEQDFPGAQISAYNRSSRNITLEILANKAKENGGKTEGNTGDADIETLSRLEQAAESGHDEGNVAGNLMGKIANKFGLKK